MRAEGRSRERSTETGSGTIHGRNRRFPNGSNAGFGRARYNSGPIGRGSRFPTRKLGLPAGFSSLTSVFGGFALNGGNPGIGLAPVVDTLADPIPNGTTGGSANQAPNHAVAFVKDGTGGSTNAHANGGAFSLWTPATTFLSLHDAGEYKSNEYNQADTDTIRFHSVTHLVNWSK